MKLPSRVSNIFDLIRSSLWFVPTVMLLGAAILARLLLWVDRSLSLDALRTLPGVDGLDAGTARTILSTLAGSMMTITGVVFSITVVSLTLASSQFGPRLLRTFMRDRATQASLGAFLATFLFCLLILVSIGGRSDPDFVPNLSVMTAVALSVLSVGVMAYFIHHVANSIQVSNVIAGVAEELDLRIEELYPEEIGEPPDDRTSDADAFRERMRKARTTPVTAHSDGYVRVIQGDGLLRLARTHDLAIDLVTRPGDFVFQRMTIMEVRRNDGDPIRVDVLEALAKCVVTGRQRTTVQDLDFSIDQLVEVAQRALSPGINDPQTAIRCVHRLGQGMSRLVNREPPRPLRVDEDGIARVVAKTVSFETILRSSFERIARAATDQPEVEASIRDTLRAVATLTDDPNRHRTVIECARRLEAPR